MFQHKFVNRQAELTFLEERYHSPQPQFVVLYGRRRVGKTDLIRQFLHGKPHLYFLADEGGDKPNMLEIQKLMAATLQNTLFGKAAFSSWVELFSEFSRQLPAKSRPVVVLDEFPYLIKGNKAIPSLFQKIWDQTLSKKDVMLVLLGSSVSMMETQVLGYTSPLYGRRTGQWKVEPLPVTHLHAFLPYTADDLVQAYAVLDSIPLYLRQFNPAIPFTGNLLQHVFRKGETLYEEAEILLRQEVREPAHYFSILKSISFGNHKFGEIAGFCQLEKTLISKYLSTLQQLRLVEKEFPVTQKKEMRNARYVLSDQYIRFWFRFVYPNRSLIEAGRQDELLKQEQENLRQHVSFTFEKVWRALLPSLHLPFTPQKTGRWWHKGTEIDIVALNEQSKDILFGECKWQENVDAAALAAQLKQKAAQVDWHPGERTDHFALFAKSFRKPVPGVLLFDRRSLSRLLHAQPSSRLSVKA